MASAEGSDSKPIHILFVGAGAVGCFYASRLHHPSKNIHVSLVARSNYPTLSRSGIELETRNFGNYHFTPHAVHASIDEAAAATPPSGWSYVMVTTKALPDVTDDAAAIEPVVGAGATCIVLIQNGVGIEEAHRKRFPRNPIVSAVTVISAEQVRHGVVRQNRWTRISMGAYTDGLGVDDESAQHQQEERHRLSQRGDACVRELVHLFNDLGGLRDAEFYDEVSLQQVRWHKLLINAAFNPSAILSGGRGNADMVTDAELRAHLHGIMAELYDAAPRILGRPFPDKLAAPDTILKSTERNKGGKPSMLLDWERGQPLELEVILGLPIRIARQRGVELPRLQTVYALLKSAVRERDARLKAEKEEGSPKL
ncbi:2-dehydropantoate 2-reductase [Phyllosticta citricarpa]|uniref:2-dehydropantoate 2-reductase n=2 Tax=Phyllosticta TaxID=121621 RepID=A0ABR1N2I7_9PEZI